MGLLGVGREFKRLFVGLRLLWDAGDDTFPPLNILYQQLVLSHWSEPYSALVLCTSLSVETCDRSWKSVLLR